MGLVPYTRMFCFYLPFQERSVTVRDTTVCSWTLSTGVTQAFAAEKEISICLWCLVKAAYVCTKLFKLSETDSNFEAYYSAELTTINRVTCDADCLRKKGVNKLPLITCNGYIWLLQIVYCLNFQKRSINLRPTTVRSWKRSTRYFFTQTVSE